MNPLYTFTEVKQLVPSLGIKELEMLKTTIFEDKEHYSYTELKAMVRMLELRVKFIASFEAKVMSWFLTYKFIDGMR